MNETNQSWNGALVTDETPPGDVGARRRKLVLAAMCLALGAVMASVSALNVALQTLAVEFGASQGELLWVANSYTVMLASLLLPIGAVGDRWGRKTVLIAGLLLFIVASVAAAFATGTAFMIAMRVLAGIAAAGIMPVTLSIITSTFPDDERPQAVGVWSGVAGAGGLLGLLASAAIIDYFSWPWVFAFPVALALASLALTLAVVEASSEEASHGFDIVGAVLSFVAIGGLVLGIHEGPEVGWTYPLTLVGLIAGGVALVGFVVVEKRHPDPLLDVNAFRSRSLAAGSLTIFVTFVAMFGIFLTLILYLQAVLDYSALRSAVGLLPMMLLLMPLSTAAPAIAQRVGTWRVIVAGLVVLAGALVFLAIVPSVDGGYLSVLPGIMLLGTGAGLAMTPSTVAITDALPAHKQGVASALNDTMREIGGAVGVALLGSVLTASYRTSVADSTNGLPDELTEIVEEGVPGALAVADQLGPDGAALAAGAREAFVDGWHSAMWAGVAVIAVAIVFVVVRSPSGALRHGLLPTATPCSTSTTTSQSRPHESQPTESDPT